MTALSNYLSSNSREWTQKALEEEQKKRDEERRKRDEEREKKKQQQQQQQSLKQSEVGNVSTPASNAGGRGTPSSQQATVPVRLKKNFASPVRTMSYTNLYTDEILRAFEYLQQELMLSFVSLDTS